MYSSSIKWTGFSETNYKKLDNKPTRLLFGFFFFTVKSLAIVISKAVILMISIFRIQSMDLEPHKRLQ